MKKTLCLVAFWLLAAGLAAFVVIGQAGCSLWPSRVGKISIPGGGLMSPVSVDAPKDAGKPGTVDTASEQSGIKVPKGSAITVTKTEAVAATETTPAKPAFETITFAPSADTEWYQRAQKIAASTGTVDTSVAKKRIDAEERRPLLWIALGALVGAVALRALVPTWPLFSNAAGAVAVVSFAAWKISEVPAWLIGAIAVGAVLIALAYKRGEWDKNGDGIPDFLETKK